ncbi:MAG: MmcQ/YjbR family DNA-binding protein [Bacteroidaceae bacterium]|nr:MmcQ/YjbR family DNA-binding protein [Bacteroidaceae bacterium]
MDIETVRDYCLSLPLVTEDFPFDETTLVFRVGGKIFAMMDLEHTEWFVLKCEPEYALELRERHPEIAPAWHMNKKYWNQLNLFSALSDGLIQSLICHSYNEVVKKMPKKVKAAFDIRLLPAIQKE